MGAFLLWLHILILCGTSLCGSETVPAAEELPMLIVTVRDHEGIGIPQLTVIIRDRSGAREFARSTTDPQGVARFDVLPTQEIRVAVQGQMPTGVLVRQIGLDVDGVLLLLNPPAAHLDLRAEPDGLLLPDPSTMLALEPGVVISASVAIPTAPVAPTLVSATASASTGYQDHIHAPEDLAPLSWIAIALLLTGLIATLIVLSIRWRYTG